MKNKIIDILLTLLVIFNLLTFLTPYTWLFAIPIYLVMALLILALKRNGFFKRTLLIVPLIPVPMWLILFVRDYFINLK